MSARILILTAGFGEGHNAAARALVVACDARHGPGTARLVDVFALAQPRLNEMVRRSYLGLINRAPQAWNVAYRWLDRSTLFPRTLGWMHREIRVLDRIIAEERPEALCSTYPIYAFLIRVLARRGRVNVPHYNVVTDSISINSLWWRAGADGWFVPNEDSAEVMRGTGTNPSRVHVTGFPVAPFFSEHAGVFFPPDLGAGAAPRVLYIINSGTAAAAQIARRLLTGTNWEVTCTVGRNETLRAELQAIAATRRYPTTILGWTSEIPRLLMTHHVVISKAGGATTQEALAARCPMIVNQIVPGQEEGNYELLRRHGIGALAETPETVIAELQKAFAGRGRVWWQWRNALNPLARPDAARDIVRHLFNEPPPMQEPIPLPLRLVAAPV